jgi:rare lipoprotein A (peptidoglycan hydrolase)
VGTDFGGVKMGSFYGLQRLALVSLVCSFAYITINAAQAEIASVYGGEDGHCGSRTANGERVNCAAMTAAHRTLPFDAAVKVCHNGCVVVRINDRGPFVGGRHIDLTPAAARAIGLDGVGHVTMAPDR